MKTTMVVAVSTLLMLIATGCQTNNLQSNLVGTWECTELAHAGRISEFAKWTVIIQVDGKFITYVTNEKGEKITGETGNYVVRGNRLWFGSESQIYRVAIVGKQLTMEIVEAESPEVVGIHLVFQKKE